MEENTLVAGVPKILLLVNAAMESVTSNKEFDTKDNGVSMTMHIGHTHTTITFDIVDTEHSDVSLNHYN